MHACNGLHTVPQGEAVVQQRLTVDGKDWLFTCVSMGNPHAITYGLADGTTIKVGRWMHLLLLPLTGGCSPCPGVECLLPPLRRMPHSSSRRIGGFKVLSCTTPQISCPDQPSTLSTFRLLLTGGRAGPGPHRPPV